MKLLSCNSVNIMHQTGHEIVRCNRRHCKNWQPRHVKYLGHGDEMLLLTPRSIYSLESLHILLNGKAFCTQGRNNLLLVVHCKQCHPFHIKHHLYRIVSSTLHDLCHPHRMNCHGIVALIILKKHDLFHNS